MELLLISLLAGLGFSLSGLFEANGDNYDFEAEDNDTERYDEHVIRADSDPVGQEGAEPEVNPEAESEGSNQEADGIVVSGSSNVTGSDGDDTITGWTNLFGGSGDDTITANNFGGEYQAAGAAFGGDGDDTIVAHGGMDGDGQLYGGNGNDILVGRAGADFEGGEGDDTIVATASSLSEGDVLVGTGRDLVLVEGFSIGGESQDADYSANITIEDFSVGEDRLGILVRPEDLEGLTYSKDLVNGGADTRITMFFSNSLNDIEVNSPIEIILSGLTDTENLIVHFYRTDTNGGYEPFATAAFN